MAQENLDSGYARATREKHLQGVYNGERPSPTLEEARSEFAQALRRQLNAPFVSEFGPIVGVLSEVTIEKFLIDFETKSAHYRDDLRLLLNELFIRIIQSLFERRL